jgi:hypothetical protein
MPYITLIKIGKSQRNYFNHVFHQMSLFTSLIINIGVIYSSKVLFIAFVALSFIMMTKHKNNNFVFMFNS